MVTAHDPRTITLLLEAVGQGRKSAADELWELVYDELMRMARGQLAGEPQWKAMGPASLVHEAYVRLVGAHEIRWVNRRHFFATAGRAMRQIRVDAARDRLRQKRGGGRKQEPLREEQAVFDEDPTELLALNEALDRLEEMDPRLSEVVHLRYFAGLNVKEVAEALQMSKRSVEAKWTFARSWLHRGLNRGAATESASEGGHDT